MPSRHHRCHRRLDHRRHRPSIWPRTQPYCHAWVDEKANDQGPRTVIQGNSHLNHGPRTLKLGKWCPGADSNHRHADFQSAALPTELPGLPAGGTACEDLPKTAEAHGITGCQHAVQREIEALPASKNSMCAGGYSCSGGLPAPASDSIIESSAPSTAGMA